MLPSGYGIERAIMTKTKPFSQLTGSIENAPARMASVEQYERTMEMILALGELRAKWHMTQQELARELNVSQANISKIEHKDDIYLSTLQNYVSGLGGRLEINVVFPDQKISLVAPE
jgi:DNA-binding XRE family transcriptional regulator